MTTTFSSFQPDKLFGFNNYKDDLKINEDSEDNEEIYGVFFLSDTRVGHKFFNQSKNRAISYYSELDVDNGGKILI